MSDWRDAPIVTDETTVATPLPPPALAGSASTIPEHQLRLAGFLERMGLPTAPQTDETGRGQGLTSYLPTVPATAEAIDTILSPTASRMIGGVLGTRFGLRGQIGGAELFGQAMEFAREKIGLDTPRPIENKTDEAAKNISIDAAVSAVPAAISLPFRALRAGVAGSNTARVAQQVFEKAGFNPLERSPTVLEKVSNVLHGKPWDFPATSPAITPGTLAGHESPAARIQNVIGGLIGGGKINEARIAEGAQLGKLHEELVSAATRGQGALTKAGTTDVINEAAKLDEASVKAAYERAKAAVDEILIAANLPGKAVKAAAARRSDAIILGKEKIFPFDADGTINVGRTKRVLTAKITAVDRADREAFVASAATPVPMKVVQRMAENDPTIKAQLAVLPEAWKTQLEATGTLPVPAARELVTKIREGLDSATQGTKVHDLAILKEASRQDWSNYMTAAGIPKKTLDVALAAGDSYATMSETRRILGNLIGDYTNTSTGLLAALKNGDRGSMDKLEALDSFMSQEQRNMARAMVFEAFGKTSAKESGKPGAAAQAFFSRYNSLSEDAKKWLFVERRSGLGGNRSSNLTGTADILGQAAQKIQEGSVRGHESMALNNLILAGLGASGGAWQGYQHEGSILGAAGGAVAGIGITLGGTALEAKYVSSLMTSNRFHDWVVAGQAIKPWDFGKISSHIARLTQLSLRGGGSDAEPMKNLAIEMNKALPEYKKKVNAELFDRKTEEITAEKLKKSRETNQ